MKNLINYIIFGLLIALISGCTDILDVEPKGIITDDLLTEPEHIDGLVTAAYAHIPRTRPTSGTLNPWITSVRSDDAYKGGGGLDDQASWYQMEVFSLVTANIKNNDNRWFEAYKGISRANSAIRVIIAADEANYPLKNSRLAEVRFLRGWIYFKLKLIYKWIPYVDENATPDEITVLSNRPEEMVDDMALWQKIYDDFKFAADNLPPTQVEIGRPNLFAAKAFLARTLLSMAYPQDDAHAVTGLDSDKLNEALEHLDDIILEGGYRLSDDFAHNFMYEWDNSSPESIWELQFTVDDGTKYGNVNGGNGLNSPWWSPHFSCCDFHKASFNMVNAFRVGENGLPLFDTFNDEEVADKNEYFADNTWDPRLGHTVAIPGFPWKYSEVLFDSTGTRDPARYGHFHSMKENVRTDSPGLRNYFWMFNSKNQQEVRLAEVLLWKAEILIQTNRHMEALPIINEIRTRAANSVDLLKLPNGSQPVNYRVEPYVDGENITWDKNTAWEALMWENRLEMAMEGRRFNDLVRWGIVAETMNSYFEKERERYDWFDVAFFTKGRDEYMPIPQPQMNWSKGVYKQNKGY